MDRTVRSEYYKRHQKVGGNSGMVVTTGLLAAVGGAAAYVVYNTLISTKVSGDFDALPEAVKKHFRIDTDISENSFYKAIKKNIVNKRINNVKFEINGMRITIHTNKKSPTKGIFEGDVKNLTRDIMIAVFNSCVEKSEKAIKRARDAYESMTEAKKLVAQTTKQINDTAKEIDRIEFIQGFQDTKGAKKAKQDTKAAKNVEKAKQALRDVEAAQDAVEQCQKAFEDITAQVDELENLEKIAKNAITQLIDVGITTRNNPITKNLKTVKTLSKAAEKTITEGRDSVDTVEIALQAVLSTEYMTNLLQKQQELVKEEEKQQQKLAKQLAKQRKQVATQEQEQPAAPQPQAEPQPQAVQEQPAVPLPKDDQDEQGGGGGGEKFRLVGGVSTPAPIFYAPKPESIISPTYVADVPVMRRDFMENLKKMIADDYNATTDPILAPLKNENSATTMLRIPHDIDPFKLRGNIVFVDYMNMVGDDKITSFEQKLANLSDRDFLRNGPIQWARDAIKSQQIDWVFIITQGKESEYVLDTNRIYSTNVVILHAPCTTNGVKTCSSEYGKNEVDDYYLLYFVYYLTQYREFIKKHIRYLGRSNPKRVKELKAFLEQQRLHILSNDNYKFADSNIWARNDNVKKVKRNIPQQLAVIGTALQLQPR